MPLSITVYNNGAEVDQAPQSAMSRCYPVGQSIAYGSSLLRGKKRCVFHNQFQSVTWAPRTGAHPAVQQEREDQDVFLMRKQKLECPVVSHICTAPTDGT